MKSKLHELQQKRNLLFTSQEGGIVFRTVIIILTLCAVGGAVYLVLHQTEQKQEIDHRKALAVCEYGLMIALQQVQTASVPADIDETEYNDGWYKVFFHRYVKNDTVFLAIRAQGRAGEVTESRECVLRRVINEKDTSWVRESMH